LNNHRQKNNKRNVDVPVLAAIVITSAVACRHQKNIIIRYIKMGTHHQHTLPLIVMFAAVFMINRAVVIVTVVTAIVMGAIAIVVTAIAVSVLLVVKYALCVAQQHRSSLISE
jgi:uncharacterized membrane protein YfbV (UPF0208 family)